MTSVVRGTSLRAGGACVRCRKGKTKCVYEDGRAPCKNCAKGLHECYLPSESLAHHHAQSPARPPRPRETLPGDRSASQGADRQAAANNQVLASQRPLPSNTTADKITPDLIIECERVISKTLPSCVAFHKPSFSLKLKNGQLDQSIMYGLLTVAARSSPAMIRRFGGSGQNGAATAAAEHWAAKTISLIMSNMDVPNLADIQAMCLLVIHEWGCRNAIRAYIYLGQAARMAQMYRITSQHQQRQEPDQFIKEESFRRTLWLIYILDCFLTSSPGRHPALSSMDIKDVALPCQDQNFHFGTPVWVTTLGGTTPRNMPNPAAPLDAVGEFGYIVMATQAWRNVIEMLTSVTVETFSEQQCQALDNEIEHVRRSLPPHFIDKPEQIDVHITMGSGYTYAMLHSLLHCATIMVNRRRLLQIVTTEGFNNEAWRMVPHTHLQIVDRVFAASHSIVQLLLALEANAEKESLLCFPLVMLFSCFTAGSTVAWFSLKGLTPTHVGETAEGIVRDAMRFLQDGADAWTLAVPWWRHLTVMAKVLRNGDPVVQHDQGSKVDTLAGPAPVKDDVVSQPENQTDNQSEPMDYERPHSAQPSEQPNKPPTETQETELPRRTGFTTINGGGSGTPAPSSPPPAAPQVKGESPNPPSSNDGAQGSDATAHIGGNDMTAGELCAAFERQLLELDDLAAFMGGGV